MARMIVAIDRSNAIGWKDGRLPWKISDDLKRFKALTMGHPVVMGWNTYVSLNRPAGLLGRQNVVLTSKSPLEVSEYFESTGYGPLVSDTITFCKNMEYVKTLAMPWIIGGASVYARAIEEQLVDELYITLVDVNSGADVSLPFDLASLKLFQLRQVEVGVLWHTMNLEHVRPPDGPSYTFITMKRIT
jgi:dihydrofolate reductase